MRFPTGLSTAVIVFVALIQLGSTAYQVGTGIADVTGPAAEINMASHSTFSLSKKASSVKSKRREDSRYLVKR